MTATSYPVSLAEWEALDAVRSEKLRELWDMERRVNRLLGALPPMREEIARLDRLLNIKPEPDGRGDPDA